MDRHRDVNYCTENAASLMVNDRRFRQLDVVVDDANEIEMKKKTVTYTMSIHVGFFVLQYAKMRMLQFYYEFIIRYLERPHFQYCEMDTDSAYLALAGESVDDLVTSELREHYFRHRSEWLPSECCDEHQNEYVRCRLDDRLWVGDEACCKARKAYDKRTPGLFKVEWSGDGFVGLWCYGEWQEANATMYLVDVRFDEGLPSTNMVDTATRNLTIIEDLMAETEGRVTTLFTKNVITGTRPYCISYITCTLKTRRIVPSV